MPPRDAVRRFLRDMLLMGLAYGLVSKAVLTVDFFGNPTGLVFWPGAGLTLGMLLRSDRSRWPALLTGVFVAEVLVDLSIPVSLTAALGWAVANTVEPLVGALLLTRGGRTVLLDGASAVFRFVLLGVLVGPLIGSLVGAGIAAVTGVADFWPTWPRWWVGDAVGVIVLAPAIFTRPRPDLAHARPAETAWIAVGLTAVTVLAMVPWPGEVWQQGLPYLLAPALAAAALRLEPSRATMALAGVGLTVNAVTAMAIGPFAEYGTYAGLVVAQVCIGAAAWATLTVSALNYGLVDRTRVEQLLREQALHDGLTGLANRRLLLERLTLAVESLHRQPGWVAVYLVDVDRFKVVNDTHGHLAGDAVLREVGARLRECVRPADTVARLGGDEFAVVVSELPGPAAADEVRQRMLHAVQLPLAWDDRLLPLSVSIGVATTDDHRTTVDELLGRADTDMYHHKRTGTDLVT